MTCPRCKGIGFIYVTKETSKHRKIAERCPMYTHYFEQLKSLDDPVVTDGCSAAATVHSNLRSIGLGSKGRGKF